ncbi:Protein of unknown function [Gryllus bimaculatus]|nr:Protein of unknown function [Gryllus bimaculatus]
MKVQNIAVIQTVVAVVASAVFDPRPPVIFKADHPFLFIITNVNDVMLLFYEKSIYCLNYLEEMLQRKLDIILE